MKADAQTHAEPSRDSHSGGGTLSFADVRPGAVAQRKLSDMAANSPQSQRHRALADAIHAGPVMQQRQALATPISQAGDAARQPIQRKITMTDQPDATTDGLIGQVNGRTGGLNALHLRSAMYQFDHDNRTFADNAALDNALTPAINARAASNVVGVWEPERLEAKTSVGGTEYNFNMSYKHLRDTYRRSGRGYGAGAVVNTILMLDDAAAMAAFEAMVADVRANVLAPALAHPHPLAQGTPHVHGGVTYVIEHSPVVHVYPTAGGATQTLSNGEYAALTTFARWQTTGDTERGPAVASQVAIQANAAVISAVTGVADVVGTMTTGVRTHHADRIDADIGRITAGMAAAELKITTVNNEFNAKAVWKKPAKRNLAQHAVARGIAAIGPQRALVATENLASLRARILAGTLTGGQADVIVGRAAAALATLNQAAQDARGTFDIELAEDDVEPDADDGDMGFALFG